MKPLTTDEEVHALLHAAAASAAFKAAIHTGLLWMLAEKAMNGEEVSRCLKIPGKRGHYWLQYLQTLGVLDRVPEGYIPSTVTRSAILETNSRESWQHLVIDESEKDACVHGLIQYLCEPGSLWTAQGMDDPISYVDRMRADPKRAEEFARMLFQVHQALGNEVAELLDLAGVECMLDLGGNSGVISMALLRKYPALTSTIVDIPNVCAAGRKIVAEQGFAGRIRFYPAEFAADPLPSGFDLVLQCDVGIYDIELLQKIYRSLKPGGRLIYIDHFAPAENLAPKLRVEWTFLDSLHDPDFAFPTVAEWKERLAENSFELLGEPQTLGRGWVVLEALKKERCNGGRGSILEQLSE